MMGEGRAVCGDQLEIALLRHSNGELESLLSRSGEWLNAKTVIGMHTLITPQLDDLLRKTQFIRWHRDR